MDRRRFIKVRRARRWQAYGRHLSALRRFDAGELHAAAPANCDASPMMQLNSSPSIMAVHFIMLLAPPAGWGETGLPAAAPAVCDTILAATGQRMHTLPFVGERLQWS